MAVETNRKYNFAVEIDGLPVGWVQKAKLPEKETVEAEYGNGALPNIKEPGKDKVTDCELEGVTIKNIFFEQWQKKQDKKLVFIKLFGKDGKVIKKWELKNCWVKKTSPGELDAKDDGKDLLMDKVTLSVEDYDVVLG